MKSKKGLLSLVVCVFEGGTYWKECWKSILECQNYFDEIIVSINYSLSQALDLSVLNEQTHVPFRLFLRPKAIPAPMHIAISLAEAQSEYVFALCHDDLLNIQGIRELRAKLQELTLKDQKKIAFFGSLSWFSASQEAITKRYFLEGPISVTNFIQNDFNKSYSISVSGICLNSELVRHYKQLISAPIIGYRMDYLLLTLPEIEKISETSIPVAFIRLHSNQVGRIKNKLVRAFDTTIYYRALLNRRLPYKLRWEITKRLLKLLLENLTSLSIWKKAFKAS